MPDAFLPVLGAERGTGSVREPTGIPEAAATDLALHYEERLGEMWRLLLELHSAAGAAVDDELDDDESSRARAALRAELDDVASALGGGFSTGQRVEVLVVGHSRWPAGPQRRVGTVLKAGNTAYAYLVALDEPLGEDKVVNVPSIFLRPLAPRAG